MKTKIFLTACIACLLAVATSTAQELTKRAIVSWKAENSLDVAGKVCDVLIKNGTLKLMKEDEKANGETTSLLINLSKALPIEQAETEVLIGRMDGYTIITLTGNDKEDGRKTFLLMVSKGDAICHFNSNGTISLIEFVNSSWSTKQTDTIESIRKFVNEKLVPLYK